MVAKATAAVRRSESASARLPKTSALKGNYPNPFRQTTTIAFELAEQAPVQLVVYDLLKREVATLINEACPRGHAAWNGMAPGRTANGFPAAFASTASKPGHLPAKAQWLWFGRRGERSAEKHDWPPLFTHSQNRQSGAAR